MDYEQKGDHQEGLETCASIVRAKGGSSDVKESIITGARIEND